MAKFWHHLYGHFGILQAKIGLKMAKLGCYESWLNLDHHHSNLKELQGVPLAESGALNGLRCLCRATRRS